MPTVSCFILHIIYLNSSSKTICLFEWFDNCLSIILPALTVSSIQYLSNKRFKRIEPD
nr:MAG TPA: hypothetical protein [Caudoviricetes sp.]